jgi:hypothetical protein
MYVTPVYGLHEININIMHQRLVMIFRYLFPATVPSFGTTGVSSAILKVNRKINLEASSILYKEVQFEAEISARCIKVQGKMWLRSNERRKSAEPTIDQAFCRTGLQRIEDLAIRVVVEYGISAYPSIMAHGISQEQHELYEERDSVWNFVKLLTGPSGSAQSQSPTLKQLKIQPVLKTGYDWGRSEVMTALFFVIEPFRRLSPIKHPVLEAPTPPLIYHPLRDQPLNLTETSRYKLLQKRCLSHLKGPASGTLEGSKDVKLETRYHDIEKAIQVICSHDTAKAHPWIQAAFHGIEAAAHLAALLSRMERRKILAKSEMLLVCDGSRQMRYMSVR